MISSIPRHLFEIDDVKIYKRHSDFKHTVNFACDDDIIALHDHSREASPMGIILEIDEQTFVSLTQPIQSLIISKDRLLIEDVAFNIVNLSFTHHNLIRHIDKFGFLDDTHIHSLTETIYDVLKPLDFFGPSLTSQSLNNRIHDLKNALNHEKDCFEAIYNLIGFGEGLTPSGDDIVSGLLAGLLLSNQFNKFHEIKQHVLKILENKNATSIISRNFINYACKGIFIESILSLHSALSNQIPVKPIVTQIGQMGQTSGRDYLMGLSVGITSGGKNYDS
jgi:hypothetical protein